MKYLLFSRITETTVDDVITPNHLRELAYLECVIKVRMYYLAYYMYIIYTTIHMQEGRSLAENPEKNLI